MARQGEHLRQGLLGNQRVLESLARIAASSTLGHAYIFAGPEGIGKLRAAVAFARAVNCRCDGATKCDSCKAMETLNHPELLLLADANKPRWLKRDDLIRRLGLSGPEAPQRYAETVIAIYEREFLEEPLPPVERASIVDGFNIVTDLLFGQGSVPSKECYTPGQVSDTIRRAFDKGGIAEPEFLLLRELYEYPLSVMPYRGSIPLAYITSRKDWKSARPVQSFLSVRSLAGGRKVVVMDDAHKMTAQAQNCLLKTLEEPPSDSLLVLVTHDRQGLFPTVVSRCQVVNFERLSRSDMERAAGELLGEAGRVRPLVAALAENCPGRLLDLASTDVEERLRSVRDFFAGVAQGRLESALALSSAVLADAPGHRKKLEQAARLALELVVFWTTEIARARHGLPCRSEGSEFTEALREQAGRFDEGSLLDVAARVEAALGTLAWNVDISLVLDATLLGVARALACRQEARA
jgi:DNA polymerase III delta prime subunit